MQTGREFFIHGLTDIYDAEQQLPDDSLPLDDALLL